MNLTDDIKTVCKNYMRKCLQRGEEITLINLKSILDIEFSGDWTILFSSDELDLWFKNMVNLNYIEKYKNTEELLIHDCNNCTSIETKTFRDVLQIDQDELELSIEVLCLKEKIDWNHNNPFVSFKTHLHGKDARVSLIHKCLSNEHSHKASIRFHSSESFSLTSFFSDLKTENKVREIFKNKDNILISGATGSGKTSFISSLVQNSKDEEHVFIIEDTHELLSPNKSTTRLISKNSIGHKLEDYCTYALRMRPDRVIVGEIRSSEATPFILNANNGHKGLLSTIHANSASKAPQRLATLLGLYSGISAINNDLALDLICSGVNYVIHLENKKVVQIIKLLNSENGIIHFDDILESSYEHQQLHYPFVS